ncbi:hypothetical protein C3K47_12000 [Solitalea longa]|uniref:Uncharacterized protein n=1 Tax=Solitalea longa TaxID=2079460 RepID=A0A2S5A1I6_9SPHI|nr:hypothetical protein C3K47_12000 [Solitalea longa]
MICRCKATEKKEGLLHANVKTPLAKAFLDFCQFGFWVYGEKNNMAEDALKMCLKRIEINQLPKML